MADVSVRGIVVGGFSRQGSRSGKRADCRASQALARWVLGGGFTKGGRETPRKLRPCSHQPTVYEYETRLCVLNTET